MYTNTLTSRIFIYCCCIKYVDMDSRLLLDVLHLDWIHRFLFVCNFVHPIIDLINNLISHLPDSGISKIYKMYFCWFLEARSQKGTSEWNVSNGCFQEMGTLNLKIQEKLEIFELRFSTEITQIVYSTAVSSVPEWRINFCSFFQIQSISGSILIFWLRLQNLKISDFLTPKRVILTRTEQSANLRINESICLVPNHLHFWVGIHYFASFFFNKESNVFMCTFILVTYF